jgi:hypothetical protein
MPKSSLWRPRPAHLAFVLGVLAFLSFSSGKTRAADRIEAPELVGGVDDLGSKDPIRLKDLRGKIVLLDFWTLC